MASPTAYQNRLLILIRLTRHLSLHVSPLTFSSVQRSLPLPFPWGMPKAEPKRPSRSLPPATSSQKSFAAARNCARAESGARRPVPQPRCAALRCAVLGSSSDGVWLDVARPLSTPCSGNVLLLYLQGPVLQGYCNKKTLLSNHFGVHFNIGAFTVLSKSSSHNLILALLLKDQSYQSYLLARSTFGDEPPMACLPICTVQLAIYLD